MLYPKQAECLNLILKTMRNPKQIAQQHLYLSGEMGSGKTYIASRAIGKMQAKKALVVCPATVVSKWKKVYCEINDEKPESVMIYHPKTDNFYNALKDDKIKLIVVSQNNLANMLDNNRITNDPDDPMEFKHDILTTANNAFRGLTSSFYTDKILFLQPTIANLANGVHHFTDELSELNKIDFLVFDEVHNYKPGHLDFSAMHFLLSYKMTPALFLTGTLFNQNLSNLLMLLMTTNPALIESLNGLDNRLSIKMLADYGFFDANIWRKVAVKINLGQVKKKDDLKQKIMPLKPLQLSPIQAAWLAVANANLRGMGYTPNAIDQKTTAYLDLPSIEQPSLTRTSNGKKEDYQMAVTLLPIKAEKTAKFIELKKILKQNAEQKTLIFVQSKKLITHLVELLPNSFSLPDSISKNKRESYINHKFNDENYQIGIMIAKKISVGIDIQNVENIVWYQVPDNVAEILQAQRRIMRLDSGKSSKIYFLYYQNTVQEDIIKQVSQSAVHNAANYNVRDTSNLAKMTHILFEGIGG